MPIIASELKLYRSNTISDGTDNGGGMSASQAGSGVANAIFPNVSEADRVAGLTTLRKVFYKVANDLDLEFLNSKAYISQETIGDDGIAMHIGTAVDVAGDLTGSENLYGCAKLNADANSGASSIQVIVEDWTNMPIFRDGDEIRISNKANVSDVGEEEFNTISGAPGVVGNIITLTLANQLVASYSAADTRVSSVINLGSIKGAYSNLVITSAAGTYNDTTYPILVDSIGGIAESYTLTFTSATDFTCIGSLSGSLGAGSISADFSPVNSNFVKPFFVLKSAGFGGTYSSGDTITFTTTPAAAPLWLKRIVPAGATSISGNNFIVALQGESA